MQDRRLDILSLDLIKDIFEIAGGLYQVLIRKGLILGFLISTHKNSSASFDKSSPQIINSMAPDTNTWSTHDPQQSS